jgi:hypothetical protein
MVEPTRTGRLNEIRPGSVLVDLNASDETLPLTLAVPSGATNVPVILAPLCTRL